MFKKDTKEVDGIISHKIDNNSTKEVTKFYTAKPFPNYDQEDNKSTILKKGNINYLAKNLKKFLKLNTKFIEVGSGTCQLSNYFAIGTNMEVVAFDATLESIKIGKKFAQENNIKNVKFVNGDIFDDVFKNEYFDVVWTNGVLHHTKDPKKAFDTCIRWLKPQGYVVVGLYNFYGRFRTNFRRIIYKFLGKKIGRKYLEIFDPTLRNLKKSKDSIDAWIQDQYEHPVESSHTFNDVFEWFEKNNIQPICSIPSLKMYDYKHEVFKNFKNETMSLKKRKTIEIINEVIIQILMNFNRFGDDGGLFIVIGKKNANI